MASITKHPNGLREVQFIGIDQKRRTIRLGKVDQKTAESIRLRVEELNIALVHGTSASVSTALWLQSVGDTLHDRLVRAGLCPPRVAAAKPDEMTLKRMVEEFAARRGGLKSGTRQIDVQVKKHLVRFFGADRPVRTINVGEAGDFRRDMRQQYSEAYTAKMIMKARTVWRDAVDRKLVEVNVFSKVHAGSQVNADRQHYIDPATIERVIAVCPDSQWKLLLALSRYGGLRCPSEHLALKWSDIDWTQGRMTVRASKTEHHAGKGIRMVPLFPELRPYLRDVFDQRKEGEENVITRYRDANANLRTQLLRYLSKAGVAQWPRLFHNLRASCQTDLAERFPAHVVCRWIGNTEAVARAHYLQTTDEHFERAKAGDGVLKTAKKGDAESDAATGGTGSQPVAPETVMMGKVREILRVAKQCDPVRFQEWAVQGSNL